LEMSGSTLSNQSCKIAIQGHETNKNIVPVSDILRLLSIPKVSRFFIIKKQSKLSFLLQRAKNYGVYKLLLSKFPNLRIVLISKIVKMYYKMQLRRRM